MKTYEVFCVMINLLISLFKENGGQQQQVTMDAPTEHTNYSYQHTK